MSTNRTEATIIAEYLQRARAAQVIVAEYTQREIDDLCLSVAWEVYNDENIAVLAKLAVESTGMGNVPDKITKHKVKVLGVLRDIIGAKTVGLIEHDERTGISKYAKQVGVVGALLPVTNPTATPAGNGLGILSGGNITTENIHWRHFINVTWVSEPVTAVRPTDDEVWGDFWARHAKDAL